MTGPPDPPPEPWPDGPCYRLVLFVSGASDLSARAVSNARGLGEAHLGGRYELAVVDVHGDPSAVRHFDVIATPTLLRTSPPPLRRVVGDLSDVARVLQGLGLPSHGAATGGPR